MTSVHLNNRHRLVKMQIHTATAYPRKKSVTLLVVAVVVIILANLSDTVRADGTIKLSDYSRYDDSPKNSYNSEHANDDDSESANNVIRKRRYDGAQVWRILVEDDKQKQAIQEMEERFGEDLLLVSCFLFTFNSNSRVNSCESRGCCLTWNEVVII